MFGNRSWSASTRGGLDRLERGIPQYHAAGSRERSRFWQWRVLQRSYRLGANVDPDEENPRSSHLSGKPSDD